MNNKPLNIFHLSVKNLKRKYFRSAGLILIVAVMSFALFGISIISLSLNNGLESLKMRLGADIAVVPLEHSSDYQDIILTGEPANFYFDKSLESKIAETDGVSMVTSQFFISTLSADCCSVPVQIIGFNPGTDFVVHPWIKEVYKNKLSDNQIIVGSDILVDKSKKLKFFNKTYSVVAQLEKTSTGMDCSVYTNMATVQSIVEGARNVGVNLSVDVHNADVNNSVSIILAKLTAGYDADNVITDIRRQYDGISVVKSKNVYSGIANNLGVMSSVFKVVLLVIWILSIIVLVIIFSVTVNERKKEFALLRSLGATKTKTMLMIFLESIIISFFGGLIGIAFASIIIFPFSTYIGEVLKMPFLQPAPSVLLTYVLCSLLISTASGPLSAICSIIKINKEQAYITLRDGE